ncbi:MAG: iron-sulfur cluster repair di-iron protein [Chitinophagaceae bacterium]|nr:iron-sulfur cluster repair di-iron protein [Chitinophagaceae bacterium]MCB0700661.1 iron-sulfur cluster repair di-iron protein [Chitinophagaceae bacterium]
MNDKTTIDVTTIEPALKHKTIFDAFDNIDQGGVVLIHNDHDPKPLYYQFIEERGKCFSWTYLKKGPYVWEVEIRKEEMITDEPTVAEIVKQDISKADIFRKYGIDYCCGGKRTLDDVCKEKSIDVLKLKEELETIKGSGGNNHDFSSWSLSFLVDYIINVHHSYVNNNLPVLIELSQKVAEHHGKQYEYLKAVNTSIVELANELNTHMKKEEQILFPLIKALEAGTFPKTAFKSIKQPIWVMESEHDAAGDITKSLRQLTNDFTLPNGACNSFALLYHKIEEFEKDLHTHIHLENNILFPNAIELEVKQAN